MIFFSSYTIKHLKHKCPAKQHLKMLSAQVVCCIYLLTLLSNGSIDASSVDQDQTALIVAV